jgi:hypothetical protein
VSCVLGPLVPLWMPGKPGPFCTRAQPPGSGEGLLDLTTVTMSQLVDWLLLLALPLGVGLSVNEQTAQSYPNFHTAGWRGLN